MKYNIKDSDGNITNTIVADAEFVEANFEHYEEWVAPTPVEPTAEETARQWRDSELEATDQFVSVTDHPKHAEIIAYRQELRDWPNDTSFPSVKPVLQVV
jgi:UDP-N-acetyl-D-mannosaminuronate dehydrogenase